MISSKFTKNKWTIPLLAFVLVAVFALVDVVSDLREGAGFFHVAIELLLVLFSVGSAILILTRFISSAQVRYQRSEEELSELRKQAKHWQREAHTLVHGLSQHIDRQLDKWEFTKSEKEIALLIIKGLSFLEISEIRNVKEKTIRQQCTSIYRKASVSGRAELSAFFLEDLLLPAQDPR